MSQAPWGGLGVEISNDQTPFQVLEAANLNWEVEKHEMYFLKEGAVGVGGFIRAPRKMALVRKTDNKFYDVVSPNWKPLQNETAFEFFREFVDAGDMEMKTAGSLRDGQLVWALARMKDSFQPFVGDVIESYLLLTNPHQFGRSIDVRFTPRRVVSNTTLSISLGSDAGTAIRTSHAQKFDEDKIKSILLRSREALHEYREKAITLGTVRYNLNQVNAFFQEMFPSSNPEKVSRNAQKAEIVLNNQPGKQFGEGTWWQAFNAVTYVTDHVAGRTADSRLNSAWYGTNKDLKNKALDRAVEYAKA